MTHVKRCSVAGQLSVVSWDGPSIAETGCEARNFVSAVPGAIPRLLATFTLRMTDAHWWRPAVYVDGVFVEWPTMSKVDLEVDPDLGKLWRGCTALAPSLWDGSIHVVSLVVDSLSPTRRLLTCETSFYATSPLRSSVPTPPETPVLRQDWSTRP